MRIKQLTKRLISIAQVACDQGDFRVAGQILHVAEPLLQNAGLTLKDQRGLAILIIDVHHWLWEARNRHSTELLYGLEPFRRSML